MCQQGKTGFENCPHVHHDGDIEPCALALDPNIDEYCDEILSYWKAIKMPGKCIWCIRHEREDKHHKTWNRGKLKKRPKWLE
jgi:hypothetical protein